MVRQAVCDEIRDDNPAGLARARAAVAAWRDQNLARNAEELIAVIAICSIAITMLRFAQCCSR